MKYRIRHYTEYDYQENASVCCNRLCLTPLNLEEQDCITSDITVTPNPDELNLRSDFFGNQLAFFSIYKEHKKLRINCNSLVDVRERMNTNRAAASPMTWRDVSKQLSNSEDLQRKDYQDVIQYTLPSFYVPTSNVIKEFAHECLTNTTSLWDACHAMMKKIHTTIEFKPGFTTVNTPVESVIKLKKGVCQDFAHLMIASLRNVGLAARYVSGYIETVPQPGKEKLVGADASHAWVSVYFPGIGWVEFDPTNNLVPEYKHITVAFGRDYLDVAPIKGIVFSSGKQNLTVMVDVERLG